MYCPVLKGSSAYAGVILTLSCFFLFFSCLDSVGQLLSAHETHKITSTEDSHNSAPPRLGRMVSCGPPPPRAGATPAGAAAATTAVARAAATPGAAAIPAAATPSIEQRLRQYSDILPAASHFTAAAVLIAGPTSTHTTVSVAATLSQRMFPV